MYIRTVKPKLLFSFCIFMSFRLDRSVTKHQMSAEVFIIVSFQKENRPDCPLLYSKRKNKKTSADIWCLITSPLIKWKGLSSLGRNRVHRQCCSAHMAHKPVQQNRQEVLRAYCPNIYCAFMWPDFGKAE